jgi:hypothetical protein
LTHRPVRAVARDAHPWLIGGFLALLLTGIPTMMESATDQYGSSVFWVKMLVIAAGLVFVFTVRRKVTQTEEVRGAAPKLVAIASIGIWLFVVASARLIMLLPADFFFDVYG